MLFLFNKYSTEPVVVEIVDLGNEKIVGTKVSSQIDPHDFDLIKDIVSQKISEHKKINWYYEMTDFEGWEFSTFWRDIVFSLMNTEHFEKIVFLGENTPQNIMAEVSSVFTPAEVKYFDISSKNEAIKWIKNGL
jgi:hypothetical protein